MTSCSMGYSQVYSYGPDGVKVTRYSQYFQSDPTDLGNGLNISARGKDIERGYYLTDDGWHDLTLALSFHNASNETKTLSVHSLSLGNEALEYDDFDIEVEPEEEVTLEDILLQYHVFQTINSNKQTALRDDMMMTTGKQGRQRLIMTITYTLSGEEQEQSIPLYRETY